MRPPIFDDLPSFGHAVLGVLAGMFPEWGQLAGMVFVLYEIKEKPDDAFFDVVECYFGLVLGLLLRTQILPLLRW